MTNMKSPCQECIVRAVCNSPCKDMVNYVRQTIVNFKPKGSPLPRNEFLYYLVQEMLKAPTQIVNVLLSFNTRKNVGCALMIQDLSITGITERDEMKD